MSSDVFVVKGKFEPPNMFPTPVDFSLIPEVDKNKKSKNKDDPTIGIHYQIISKTDWNDILKESLRLKISPDAVENSTPEEEMKRREGLIENIQETDEFTTDVLKRIIEKIVCSTKKGITVSGKYFKYGETIFEKEYRERKDAPAEDITSEEQTDFRDALLELTPKLGRQIWSKFQEIMTT